MESAPAEARSHKAAPQINETAAFEPLGALPPDLREVLRALLRGYEPALRRVCRAWRAWAAVGASGASPRRWECFLAAREELGLLAWWRAERGIRFSPEVVLRAAAGAGQIEVMRRAQGGWGARDYELALGNAAEGGHLKAMELLRAWGAREYDWALGKAAEGGHLKAMEQLRAWGARNYEMGRENTTGPSRARREPASWRRCGSWWPGGRGPTTGRL